jgi:hypothetical protein
VLNRAISVRGTVAYLESSVEVPLVHHFKELEIVAIVYVYPDEYGTGMPSPWERVRHKLRDRLSRLVG